MVEESARKVVCAPAPVGRGEQHLDWLGDDDDDGDCDQFCVEFLARQHHTSYLYENLALEHYIFRLQQHFVRNLFLRHRVDEAHIASMCVIHTPYRCDERSKGCTNLPVYLLSFIFLAVLFLDHH